MVMVVCVASQLPDALDPGLPPLQDHIHRLAQFVFLVEALRGGVGDGPAAAPLLPPRELHHLLVPILLAVERVADAVLQAGFGPHSQHVVAHKRSNLMGPKRVRNRPAYWSETSPKQARSRVRNQCETGRETGLKRVRNRP
eukprot:4343461-Pyramimonas_sp.AAC.2